MGSMSGAASRLRRRAHTSQNKQVSGTDAKVVADKAEGVADKSDTLTLITSDGEIIVFDGMDVPIEEAAALISEDALGKIWNRPAEDLAWRDM